MKKALKILILIGLAGAIVAATLIIRNNRSADWPEHAELERSFERSLDWLEQNREKVLSVGNPALWWMIQQSAEISRHPELTALYKDYEDRHLQSLNNLWLPLFRPGRWVPFKTEQIAEFDDYQMHFIYAISCDQELEQHPLIQAQLDPDYCDKYPLRPACVTHQMMAFRFMQRSDCGDPQATEQAIASLQERVVRQLTLDPRVVDVYMQRVLMLLETGARDKVKPIWIQRLLEAQQADGGWSDFQPLLNFGQDLQLGFYARGIKLGKPRSDFHMTAQGVMLLSLALHPEARQN